MVYKYFETKMLLKFCDGWVLLYILLKVTHPTRYPSTIVNKMQMLETNVLLNFVVGGSFKCYETKMWVRIKYR